MSFRSIGSKIKEVGVINCVVGTIKREKYKKLRKKYQFTEWHLSPYELREYAQIVARYVTNQKADVVVDIGCGLGEVIRHIKAKKRIGLDVNENLIEAAKLLGKDITYSVGSFDEFNWEEPVDYLLTLGFMHGSTEEKWKPYYEGVAGRNDIRHFIVDTLPDTEKSNLLDFSKILPEEYKLIEKIGPLRGGRYIEVYEKQSISGEKR